VNLHIVNYFRLLTDLFLFLSVVKGLTQNPTFRPTC
jgi:hypothetical protein